MGDRVLRRVLDEIERDAQRGESDFYRSWHRRVCSKRDAGHLINSQVFNLAKGVFEEARAENTP